MGEAGSLAANVGDLSSQHLTGDSPQLSDARATGTGSGNGEVDDEGVRRVDISRSPPKTPGGPLAANSDAEPTAAFSGGNPAAPPGASPPLSPKKKKSRFSMSGSKRRDRDAGGPPPKPVAAAPVVLSPGAAEVIQVDAETTNKVATERKLKKEKELPAHLQKMQSSAAV